MVKIDDTDDEEEDLALAWRLQEEEYAKAGAEEPANKKAKREVVDDSEDGEDITVLSDSDSDIPLARNRSVKQAPAQSSGMKKVQTAASTSRGSKKTPTRASSSNARSSIGMSAKTKIADSDDEADLTEFSEADSEDFVLESSTEAVSTGVSDTESDVPLASTRPARTAPLKPARRRAILKGRGGRRHGNISARDAAQMARDIEDVVSNALLSRKQRERKKLEKAHPSIKTMWKDLENIPVIKPIPAEQPASISRRLKPFQLEGLDWMVKQEQTQYKGGLLGDEMGMGKTIQAVSLIMSDYPQQKPTLVLMPPVALMQWSTEINEYTDGKLKVLVYHGQNSKVKKMTLRELKKFDVILISYNSLESLYRKEIKGWSRGEDIIKEDSPIHAIDFHRLILDEAHSIKSRTTGVAKACFALKGTYKWCLSGTPVQNRIGEFFSLLSVLSPSHRCTLLTNIQALHGGTSLRRLLLQAMPLLHDPLAARRRPHVPTLQALRHGARISLQPGAFESNAV